jgi:hypothetical protein
MGAATRHGNAAAQQETDGGVEASRPADTPKMESGRFETPKMGRPFSMPKTQDAIILAAELTCQPLYSIISR